MTGIERTILSNLLDYATRNTCTHETTHRGGSIWEICDTCGAKWADDRDGKPEWVDPVEIISAKKLLISPPQEFEEVEVVRWTWGEGFETYRTEESARNAAHEGTMVYKLTGTIRRPVPQKVERSVSVNGGMLDDGGFEVNRPFDVFPECHGKRGLLTFTWTE